MTHRYHADEWVDHYIPKSNFCRNFVAIMATGTMLSVMTEAPVLSACAMTALVLGANEIISYVKSSDTPQPWGEKAFWAGGIAAVCAFSYFLYLNLGRPFSNTTNPDNLIFGLTVLGASTGVYSIAAGIIDSICPHHR